MNAHPLSTRRNLLRLAVATAAAVPLSAIAAETPQAVRSSSDPWRGLHVGMASYSFRKLPLDAAIKAIQRLDLHYVSIKDAHLPMNSTREQRQEVSKRFRDAGITPVSCGVITTKNDEADVRRAFEYARDIGVPTIVGNPDPKSMSFLDKFVKEFDIKMAIHNHGPESHEYKSPYDAWETVQGHDPRIGLCIDVGHTARAKVDPAEAIRKCKQRLYDLHFKDVSSPNGKNAQSEVEVGRGVLNIRSMLEALLEIGYAGHVGFEHEKNADDPLPGAAESVGYTKGVLSQIR
jgi:inosose dehydratase